MGWDIFAANKASAGSQSHFVLTTHISYYSISHHFNHSHLCFQHLLHQTHYYCFVLTLHDTVKSDNRSTSHQHHCESSNQQSAIMADGMDIDMDIDLTADPEIAQLEAEAMKIVRCCCCCRRQARARDRHRLLLTQTRRLALQPQHQNKHRTTATRMATSTATATATETATPMDASLHRARAHNPYRQRSTSADWTISPPKTSASLPPPITRPRSCSSAWNG